MANPFLSIDEPMVSVAGDASNPFIADTIIETAMMEKTMVGDNPFATSNPFADLAYEPPAGDTVPVDIFSNMDAAQFDAADRFLPPVKPTALELTPSEEHKPRRPPPPAPPAPRALPPETQNLILSVTGQMDFTSSHLLDRIPPTRTPSPVSMRDIHSPEPELEADLLGDAAAPARPARPPPPQPPAPRPPPPPRPPAAPVVSQQNDINLFEAAAPSAVKPTKEDILSLYSTKKKEEEKQVDFLSDDIAYGDGVANESPPETIESKERPETGLRTVDGQEIFSNIDKPSAQQPSDSLNDVNMEPIPPVSLEETSESMASPFGDVIDHGLSIGDIADTASNPFNDTNDASMATLSKLDSEPIVAMETGRAGSSTPAAEDAFDAFSAKFDSTFSNRAPVADAAWGASSPAWGETNEAVASEGEAGFEAEAFDPFLSMSAPPPPTTPRLPAQRSQDSADDNFTLVIRPQASENSGDATVPVLAPPPRPSATHPEDHYETEPVTPPRHEPEYEEERRQSGTETPPTPLFDEDVSTVLEPFPRTTYDGPGWEMHLRQPNKKKITGQRFWKKVFVRMTYQGDNPVVQLLNSAGDKEPFQELPLQACYSVSDIGAQQFDQFGKIFTVKLQYVFYKERPGVRPGQVTKAERITNKLSQFAAYAIQGDYQGVKEFGSDLRKLGLPVEHAPQISQLFKLGSLDYEHVKQFSSCVEEALFRLPAHRDRALQYRMEEVQLTAVDELFAEQDASGAVRKQVARVRIFFLGFLGGMPDVELGVNDMRRQGREVVGRHDIIPVATEEWIRVEDHEFHACVQPQEFLDTQIIKFKPPDACYIELMRFRVRPPRNRELPLQLKAAWCVNGNKVELRADVLVPGFTSRRLGQVPCEDVAIRFPIPECWIYLFRVEKHFRYGSVKSAHRRAGKIKGIERLLGAVDAPQESLIEVTSGQAKYEHQHRAVVWRMPRLPKEGQGAYTTHCLVARMALTSFDQVPAELARWATVEFVMPAAAVSRVTVRSLALPGHDGDPPEKYVRYIARHEYRVGIERVSGTAAPAYAVSAVPSQPPPAAAPAPSAAPAAAQMSSDSDSD